MAIRNGFAVSFNKDFDIIKIHYSTFMPKIYLLGILVALLFSSLGELVRLPWGPGNGLLPNDLWLALLGGIWLIDKTLIRRQWPKTVLLAPFATFIIIAALSLIHSSAVLAPKEVLISSLYLVRFIEYFLIIFIVGDIGQSEKNTKRLTHGLLFAGLLVALAGFIQLKWFPSFESFEQLGWDPHIGRLLSTWFDPNFTGGLLAFLAILSIALALNKSKPTPPLFRPHSILYFLFAVFSLAALLLTYSRSSYLMLVAGLGIIGLLKSKKLLLIGALAITLLLTVSPRAQERVVDLYYTGQSLFGLTAELPDATARLRLNSWRGAWTIIQDHPLLGVGYNTYTYAQANYGFIDDLKKHSASGSDSPLLTIWATTGIFGLLAYLWILGTILYTTFLQRQNTLSLGVFAGTIGLLVHSLIVNSLLFTPFLVFYYTAVGLVFTSASSPRGHTVPPAHTRSQTSS